MNQTDNQIQDMLEWCEQLGVKPLPLVSINDKYDANRDRWDGGKRPSVGDDWGNKVIDPANFRYYRPGRFNQKQEFIKPGQMRNVGFQLGAASGGLIDVDLDSPEAVERAHEFFGDIHPVEYGRNGVRTHMMFRVSDIPEDIHTVYVSVLKNEKGEEGNSYRTKNRFRI